MSAVADHFGVRNLPAPAGILTAMACGRGIRVLATPGFPLIRGGGSLITPARGRSVPAWGGVGNLVPPGSDWPMEHLLSLLGRFLESQERRKNRAEESLFDPPDRYAQAQHRKIPCCSRTALRWFFPKWIVRETLSSKKTLQALAFPEAPGEVCMGSPITLSATDL